MRARFAPATGSPVPQIIIEPQNQDERLLLEQFVHARGQLRMHGYTYRGGALQSMNFGWHLQAPAPTPTVSVRKPAYLVHEAGPLQADGCQRCAACDFVLVEAAARDWASQFQMSEEVALGVWGFPVGRRVVVTPVCIYLLTPDRELAGDEVPCR